jgi:hypothetical protein
VIASTLAAAARVRERLTAADPQDELCCVYARQVLRELYDPEAVDVVPVSRWHLHDGAHPWSPVEAAWDAGLAERVVLPPSPAASTDPLPVGAVLYCQGWSGLRNGVVAGGAVGHTFLLAVVTSSTVLRLDSAAGRAAPGAEARWMSITELRARYTSGVAVAVLRRPRALR